MGYRRKVEPASGVPESWSYANWPPAVWPGDGKKAQWIGRAYRAELLEAGALARVGNALVFRRVGYERWLDRRAAHVEHYVGNNPAIGRTEAVAG